jgi:DNA-binding winged helix-turn-helix (wHTH) protein
VPPLERLGFGVAVSRWMETRLVAGSVLALLVNAAAEVVPAQELIEGAGVCNQGTTASSLKVCICHLRVAMRDMGYPATIETVRGQGYRFVGDVAAICAQAGRYA